MHPALRVSACRRVIFRQPELPAWQGNERAAFAVYCMPAGTAKPSIRFHRFLNAAMGSASTP